MQVSLANHSEVHLFQMADGQAVIVGGHDDQGVLDSVELMNLTNPAEEQHTSGSRLPGLDRLEEQKFPQRNHQVVPYTKMQ